ncbi:MAG: antibiotic biosynthesis monooxygenase [Proteobacteria bacterium]|nr:antibiotic biosynthesis monooxygenase [Pseudomonadota bacterium]MBU1058125.1 antibiotic biosynthesis monooxygenase [Pseudomonadota bacterium]
MFTSSVIMKGRAEKRKEILQTLNGISEQVRRKKGCMSAHSYQDINDENTFCLVEVWRTKQDMDEYLHSKLYAVLLGVKTILVEAPEVTILVKDSSYSCGDKETGQVH